MKYDVFISYSRKDTAVADKIVEAFRRAKITYFIDKQGIGGGFEFPVVLAEAILESRIVLFLASENSYESKFTNAELTFAFNEKPRNSILPYIIDGSTMPPALRFVFASINWRAIDSHPVDTVLVNDILTLLGRPSVDPHVPEPEKEHVRRDIPESTELPGLKVGVKVRVKTDGQEGVAKKVYISSDGKEKCVVDFGGGNVLKKRVTSLDVSVGRTWKVGDHYNVDGKEGVVFWVDETGKHGKIVSMDQAELKWCTDDERNKQLTGIATDRSNGMNNLLSVMKIAGWKDKYPAFAWCADHGDGWYLPAIEELEELLLNDEVHSKVNGTLEQKRGYVMYSKGDRPWYWSSTEENQWSAWYVAVNLGYTHYSLRTYNHYVRAVSAF